jgi:hypothetical protein
MHHFSHLSTIIPHGGANVSLADDKSVRSAEGSCEILKNSRILKSAEVRMRYSADHCLMICPEVRGSARIEQHLIALEKALRMFGLDVITDADDQMALNKREDGMPYDRSNPKFNRYSPEERCDMRFGSAGRKPGLVKYWPRTNQRFANTLEPNDTPSFCT